MTTLNGDCFAAIFQQLKTDFALPQESNTAEAQVNTEETKNLLEQLISGIFQVVYRLTGWVASFGLFISRKENTSLWGHKFNIKDKKVKVKITQLSLTLCDPTDHTDHGILQARILQWVAYPFSSRSSWSRNQSGVRPAMQADSLPAELSGKPSEGAKCP